MRRAANLTIFMCRLSWNLGVSTSLNPQGLSRPVMGLFYLLRRVDWYIGNRLFGRSWYLIFRVKAVENQSIRRHIFSSTAVRTSTLHFLKPTHFPFAYRPLPRPRSSVCYGNFQHRNLFCVAVEQCPLVSGRTAAYLDDLFEADCLGTCDVGWPCHLLRYVWSYGRSVGINLGHARVISSTWWTRTKAAEPSGETRNARVA
jgi:hypothetical protein